VCEINDLGHTCHKYLILFAKLGMIGWAVATGGEWWALSDGCMSEQVGVTRDEMAKGRVRASARAIGFG
jgi:hypothetical protein